MQQWPNCLFSLEHEESLEGSSFAVNHPVAPKGGSESFLSVNGQSHGPPSPVMITDDREHLLWGRNCPSLLYLVSYLSPAVTL